MGVENPMTPVQTIMREIFKFLLDKDLFLDRDPWLEAATSSSGFSLFCDDKESPNHPIFFKRDFLLDKDQHTACSSLAAQ